MFTGFFAREVGKMAGWDVPSVAVHHQYFMTAPLPEVEALGFETPVIRDLEGGYYLRQERGGLLAGPYEAPDKMHLCEDWYINGPPPSKSSL